MRHWYIYFDSYNSFHERLLSVHRLHSTCAFVGKQSLWDRQTSHSLISSSSSLPSRINRNGWVFCSKWGLAVGSRCFLTNDAVRVAVSLCVLAAVFACFIHVQMWRGALVDAHGLHGLTCKQAPSKAVRQNAIKDVIARAPSSAGISATKEPTGLTRLLMASTLISWQCGKPLTCDITVVSTLAAYYLHALSHRPGGSAEFAASRKEAKYDWLARSLLFQSIALETLGPLDPSALVDFIGGSGQ